MSDESMPSVQTRKRNRDIADFLSMPVTCIGMLKIADVQKCCEQGVVSYNPADKKVRLLTGKAALPESIEVFGLNVTIGVKLGQPGGEVQPKPGVCWNFFCLADDELRSSMTTVLWQNSFRKDGEGRPIFLSSPETCALMAFYLCRGSTSWCCPTRTNQKFKLVSHHIRKNQTSS